MVRLNNGFDPNLNRFYNNLKKRIETSKNSGIILATPYESPEALTGIILAKYSLYIDFNIGPSDRFDREKEFQKKIMVELGNKLYNTNRSFFGNSIKKELELSKIVRSLQRTKKTLDEGFTYSHKSDLIKTIELLLYTNPEEEKTHPHICEQGLIKIFEAGSNTAKQSPSTYNKQYQIFEEQLRDMQKNGNNTEIY